MNAGDNNAFFEKRIVLYVTHHVMQKARSWQICNIALVKANTLCRQNSLFRVFYVLQWRQNERNDNDS